MKIRVWVFIGDGQDGSVSEVIPYKTFEEAEAAGEAEMEECGRSFDCNVKAIVIDPSDYEIVTD